MMKDGNFLIKNALGTYSLDKLRRLFFFNLNEKFLTIKESKQFTQPSKNEVERRPQ